MTKINSETPSSALRGIGRQAYRDGWWLHQAYEHARKLGATETQLIEVKNGWAAERTEVNSN